MSYQRNFDNIQTLQNNRNELALEGTGDKSLSSRLCPLARVPWCQTDLRGKDISVQKLCSNHDGQVKECRRRKYGKDPSGSFGVWSGILSFSCKHCKQFALFFLHLPNRANINTTLKFKLNTIHTIDKT